MTFDFVHRKSVKFGTHKRYFHKIKMSECLVRQITEATHRDGLDTFVPWEYEYFFVELITVSNEFELKYFTHLEKSSNYDIRDNYYTR